MNIMCMALLPVLNDYLLYSGVCIVGKRTWEGKC